VITLNRAEKRNALNRPLIAAVAEAFERARDDKVARSVILTGAGLVFCAGMDMAELQKSVGQTVDEAQVRDDALRLAKLYDLICTLPKPTIAAVNGSAIAGGAGLVSACDLAITVPHAKFGYTEVRRGLIPAIVMQHLLRNVGERTARFLLLTGELIDAAQAQRAGLVNEVVAAEDLQGRADTLARALAEGGPSALTKTKQLLCRFSTSMFSLEETAALSAAPRMTQECQDGLRAFFAKQPAPWA